MGHDSGHARERRTDQDRGLATTHLRRLAGIWRSPDEDRAREVDEHSGGSPVADRWYSNRRADGATLWHQGSDVALSAFSARGYRSPTRPDGLGLFRVPKQRHSG